MQILIADDQQECREMVRKALREIMPECHFSLAQDGTHAWWELTAPGARFDLLIVDINMPLVDGLELVKRMHEHPELKHLPVIMCTGVADEHTVKAAAHLHVSNYLVKPYKITNLIRRVLDVLGLDPPTDDPGPAV
ncbi:MAG: response regulator [Verrucomicrobiota bacterium]